jgi:hypothetical protein
MKSRPVSLLPLYLWLLLTAAYLVAAPVVLAGPPNIANCGGGRTVSCSAYKCVCIENAGCTGYDASGNKVEDNPCPAGDDDLPELSVNSYE